MNVRAIAAAIAALIALPAAAAEEVYVLDPVHSQPQFVTHHIGFSNQHGFFGKATGKVTLDRTAKAGSIDVTIDAASIKTHDPRVDAIVKGEQFFNIEKYPTITFTSSKLAFDGDRLVGADGELTIVGVTKPVHLVVTHFACGQNPFRKTPMCGAEATATIKRSEWGMTTGINLGNPADDVELTIPVEAALQQPQS